MHGVLRHAAAESGVWVARDLEGAVRGHRVEERVHQLLVASGLPESCRNMISCGGYFYKIYVPNSMNTWLRQVAPYRTTL